MASPPHPFALRPYQEQCVARIYDALHVRKLSRILYMLATGCGKTVTFAHLIRELRTTDSAPALVLAHREELLSQARNTIAKVTPSAWVEEERDNHRALYGCDVVVASIPTLVASKTRLAWLAAAGTIENPLTIIVDEAHHAGADGYQAIFERFGAYDGRARLIGCTATPDRLDKKALVGPDGEATFEEMVFEYGLADAIRDKWLCDVRGYRVVSDVDLDAVNTVAGDFNQKQLADAVRKGSRTAAAIKHWIEVAKDRQTLVFCASVAHAEECAEAWKKCAGVSAACIHGGLSSEARADILHQFRAGTIRVLANVDVLTEGFDFPPIACVVMMRPTKSWTKYAQCVGRGTRLSPGKKDLLIIDMVDNTTKHDLAMCPTLFGLPAHIDLQGESLSSAEALRQKMTAVGMKMRTENGTTLDDLRTQLASVDLFRSIATPKNIERLTPYAWLETATGYMLAVGKSPTGVPRIARVFQDALGKWMVETADSDTRYWCGNGELPNFTWAEAPLRQLWGSENLNPFGLRNVAWRNRPLSPAQSGKLKTLGYQPSVTAHLTCGQASDLINRIVGLRQLNLAKSQMKLPLMGELSSEVPQAAQRANKAPSSRIYRGGYAGAG